MSSGINRRDLLKLGYMTALGLGLTLPSWGLGNEEGILKTPVAPDGLINLSSNENPYGISPKAKEALLNALNEAHRYQYNHAHLKNFKKEIAEHYGVNEDQVLVSAGSGEALGLLPRHFNNGKLVTANPTFGILPATAKMLGQQVIEVPLTPDQKHDLPAMLKAVDNNTSLVYVCNPANPSSTIVSSASLKNFCIEASKKAYVGVDEAYIDFLDAPDNESMIQLIEKHPKVFVIGTFSKIHAMAGLRIGWVIGHASLIKTLSENYFTRTQMALSALSMSAALASLKDPTWLKLCKDKNAAARDYAYNGLKALNIDVVRSYTNFLFFPIPNYTGDFAADMLAKNIYLRSSNYVHGKWARASVGTMDEMKQFIEVMKTVKV